METLKPAVLAAAVLLCLGANASTNATDESSSSLPQERMQGSVSFLTGGIGVEEAGAVKRAESKYALALEFSLHAKPKDEFLADVNVTVEDQRGNTVLETSAAGPYLLANMPNGKYTVKAEENGKTQVRHVVIAAGKSERVSMVW